MAIILLVLQASTFPAPAAPGRKTDNVLPFSGMENGGSRQETSTWPVLTVGLLGFLSCNPLQDQHAPMEGHAFELEASIA